MKKNYLYISEIYDVDIIKNTTGCDQFMYEAECIKYSNNPHINEHNISDMVRKIKKLNKLNTICILIYKINIKTLINKLNYNKIIVISEDENFESNDVKKILYIDYELFNN